MNFRYELERWLHDPALRRNVKFDLSGSTGPPWALYDFLPKSALDELARVPLRYSSPGGSVELRQAVAEFLDVDPDWVVITSGASDALYLALLTAPNGGEVVVPNPGYPAVELMARGVGLAPVRYRLDRNRGFRHEPKAIMSRVRPNTRLVVINRPHNPTGAIMDRHDLAAVAGELRERGVSCVVDEVFGLARTDSTAGMPNLTTVGALSKIFSLPGARIGWIVERDAHRRAQLVRTRSWLAVGGSPLLESIAAHALRRHDKLIGRTRELVAGNLVTLQRAVARANERLQLVPPEGGLTAFPELARGTSKAFCRALADRGALVLPGELFGRPGHIRVGLGCARQTFDGAMELLVASMTEIETGLARC